MSTIMIISAVSVPTIYHKCSNTLDQNIIMVITRWATRLRNLTETKLPVSILGHESLTDQQDSKRNFTSSAILTFCNQACWLLSSGPPSKSMTSCRYFVFEAWTAWRSKCRNKHSARDLYKETIKCSAGALYFVTSPERACSRWIIWNFNWVCLENSRFW